MQYEIRADSCSAQIDTKGAELLSFISDGVEYIWQRDARYWPDSAPILFPNVCDLRKNRAIIEGREYCIPRHGFLYNMEFEVVEIQKNKAVFKAEYTEETMKMFPYAFYIEVVYEIRKRELQVDFKVKNLGNKRMYYQIGYHPGFRCPFEAGKSFEDYILRFDKKESTYTPLLKNEERVIDSNIPNFEMRDTDQIDLKYSYFDRDVLVFDKIGSRKVSLLNKEGKGISISFKDFEMLGIWTPAEKEAPFLCIEPWNGTCIFDFESDEFSLMKGIQRLSGGSRKKYTVTMKIEK